jgi:hypothetical protein
LSNFFRILHNSERIKAKAAYRLACARFLVGEVKAHQGIIFSWSARMISHTGTETRSRLLREAAVRNIRQWGKP